MLLTEVLERTEQEEEQVLAAVKIPLVPRPTTARLPARLTLRQAMTQLLNDPPKDAESARALQLLSREMNDVHHFLTVKAGGEVTQVNPSETTLSSIAVPREFRTPRGIEVIPVSSFEIQAYSKVGVDAS